MLNTITRPDKGTKHVQRKIRTNKKGLVCELRITPTGLRIRRMTSGNWRMARLDQLMTWMLDPKNTKVVKK